MHDDRHDDPNASAGSAPAHRTLSRATNAAKAQAALARGALDPAVRAYWSDDAIALRWDVSPKTVSRLRASGALITTAIAGRRLVATRHLLRFEEEQISAAEATAAAAARRKVRGAR
jgi:hypothetical protein